jgi:hypothetical protein
VHNEEVGGKIILCVGDFVATTTGVLLNCWMCVYFSVGENYALMI